MEKSTTGLASKKILSTREAADLLKVTPQSIKNYIYAGRLSATKTPGGHYRIPKSDLKKFGFTHREDKDLENYSMNRLRETYDGLLDSFIATIKTLIKALNKRDIVSSGHSERVANYACAVGKRMGMKEKELRELKIAALLHDVGKIAISESILSKPGQLTEQEFLLVKKHPEIGEKIVGEVKCLESIGETIRHHHERFDGTGYPDEICGNEIDLKARIIAVAEAYDFLRSEHYFKKASSIDDSIRDLRMRAGTQFDPQVVKVFIDNIQEQRSH